MCNELIHTKATTFDLIVEFEQPSGHQQVVGDKFGQRPNELFFTEDIRFIWWEELQLSWLLSSWDLV